MAIPFFEPKATTTPNNHNMTSNNNLINTTATVNIYYDQVDSHVHSMPLLSQQQSTTTTTTSPTASIPTIATSAPTTIFIPPIAPGSTDAKPTPTILPVPPPPPPITSSSIGPTIPPTASIEQQALAWKILALALCKALKEYYLQTVSSKDAFTNQTVQVLPNGDVQPLWKP